MVEGGGGGVSGGVLRRRAGDEHRKSESQSDAGVQAVSTHAKPEDRDFSKPNLHLPCRPEEEPQASVLRRPAQDSYHRKSQLRFNLPPEGLLLPRRAEAARLTPTSRVLAPHAAKPFPPPSPVLRRGGHPSHYDRRASRLAPHPSSATAEPLP
ncbi:hypothetical protein SASPL_111829 [Salvia splendens]|uniref:Uncharacterized protein n=1 Tax=Salvia splendens TaxID=180675 RepID=A0A8X8Y7Z5_SALSN|nr:hypothetical protein SASPL_111829 [Salvia splendens]